MSSPFSVKVTFEDDIRRFELEGCNYKELLEKIRQVFALKNSTNVVMKYKDNEGDLVTIATDSELECALTHQLHHNLLRLSLFTNVTKASHAPVATTEEEEDALAASVPSSEVTASSREDKLKKWKEMKEHKKTMREELKELKRRLRDELKNMSDDKDPQAMKELMEQRRKMWKQMRKMRGHCVRWRKECEEGDSSSDEEKKPKDPQAMKELMEQRRKMWQHMKELKRKKREECKKDLLESNHGLKNGGVITLMSSADEEKKCTVKDAKDMRALMRQRKMWQHMRNMKSDCMAAHCMMWRKFRKQLEDSASSSSSDEEKKCRAKHDPHAMKALMQQRRKMWQDLKEFKRNMRESCKKNSAVESQTSTAAGVASTSPSAASSEDWMSKVDMKQKKMMLREEMRRKRRNSENCSPSDEDKSKALMAHRWKMWHSWHHMKQLHKKQPEEGKKKQRM